MALNACLRYSLAFLLGATALSLFFLLELKRDVIRVEVNWRTRSERNAGRYSSQAAGGNQPMVLAARIAEEPKITPNTSANVALSRSKVVLTNIKGAESHVYGGKNSEIDLQKANNLLYRQVRQLSKSQSQSAASVLQARVVTRAPKTRPTNRYHSVEKVEMPISDALSKTAPDWVGQKIPPIDPADDKCKKGSVCLENLSEVERSQFGTCMGRTVIKESEIGKILPNVTCRFLNGTRRHPVALASFPGSGNTWMRGLLQKITGICTGSLYCDNVLRARGFTGEFIRGSSVIAIKTHGIRGHFTHNQLPRRVFNNVPIYGAAILLVRDPKSALVSEWHRERTKRQTNTTSSNHYLSVGEEYFKNNVLWDQYVKQKSKRWSDEVSGWIIAAKDNPFLVVRYEDLKDDTIHEMKKVVDFLGFSHISEADIANRLGQGYNNFYRNHTDSFGHFTDEQKAVVREQVEETIKILKESGRDRVFPILEYL